MRHIARPRHIQSILSAGALFLPLFAGLGTATPAGAQVVDNVCNASAELTFNPALTLTQHNTNMGVSDAALTSCTDHTYTDAAITASGSGSSLCLVLNIIGTGQFRWDNGQVSNLTFRVSTNPTSGKLGLSATITSGPFNGDTIEDAPVVLTETGTCVTGGITSITLDLSGLAFLHL